MRERRAEQRPRQLELQRYIAGLLRTHRQKLGLTQEAVGARAGLGAKYISEIERGRRDLPLSTLRAIVEEGLALGLELAVIDPARRTTMDALPPPLPLAIEKLARQIAALSPDPRGAVLAILRTTLGLVQATFEIARPENSRAG